MKIKRSVFFIILILLVMTVSLIYPTDQMLNMFCGHTVAVIKLYDFPKYRMPEVREKISELNDMFEKNMSVNGDGLVTQINKGQKQDLEDFERFRHMLLKCIKLSELSEGVFDISVQPVLSLWGFDKDEGYRIPEDDELKEALEKVDYTGIILSDQNILSTEDGVMINPGSFSKGMLIDEIYQYLIDICDEFLIELGGDIRVFSENGRVFRIGVRDPRGEGMAGVISLRSGEAVATSGDYERFFTSGGERYHHMINAVTGRPDGEYLSCTVVSDNAGYDDLYSTFFFLTGEKYINLLKSDVRSVYFVDEKSDLQKVQ